jgi:hypothetical protein
LAHLSPELQELTEATLVNDNGLTIIGPWADPEDPFARSYIQVAQSEHAGYFDIGDTWNELDRTTQLAANQHAMDVVIQNGDTVRLTTHPWLIKQDKLTWSEINYLLENGYVWTDDVTLAPGPGG